MLLLLLSFYIHYDLLNCEEIVTAKFNESEQHRQKLLQVNFLLEDLEQKTRKLSMLIADDPPYITRKVETYALRREIFGKDEHFQNPEISTKPAEFLSSPIPMQSLSSNAPPSAIPTRPRSEIEQNTYEPLRSLVATPLSAIKTKNLGLNARLWFQELAPYTRNKKLKKPSEDNRLTESLPPGTTERTIGSSTGPGQTAQQVNKDEHRFSSAGPAQAPDVPFRDWKTTTAGDVLYATVKPTPVPPKQRYLELMKKLYEGYLVVFGTEMFRLIAVKDESQVREVLAPLATIYNTSLESGRFVGVDNTFLTLFGKLALMTSEDGIDALRTYSSMMFHTLVKRKQVLSPEVNSIIDQAGLAYSEEEGKRLLCSLKQFEDYPNTTRSSYSICESLIESLLQPFQRRPADSSTRQRLLTSISKALRQNLPQLLSDLSVGTAGIRSGPSRIGNQPRKEEKKYRHKRKRKRKRHPQFYTTHKSQNLDYKEQWFRPITTKRHRTMNKGTTNAFISSPLTLDHNLQQELQTKQTKIIVPRKLVRYRNGTIFRQRKQKTHARFASNEVVTGVLNLATQSKRTPVYQDAPIFDEIIETIGRAIPIYLEDIS